MAKVTGPNQFSLAVGHQTTAKVDDWSVLPLMNKFNKPFKQTFVFILVCNVFFLLEYLDYQVFDFERHLIKVILETYLIKVILETYLIKVILETYLMKVILETYLTKVILETRPCALNLIDLRFYYINLRPRIRI